MTVSVVCLDGTDQTRSQICPTNIALMFNALGGTVSDGGDGSFETEAAGAGPSGKYLPGVGSQGSLPLRVLGNLFGDGIAEQIIRGYTYLSRVYTAGDSIVITGFSRGATAARALAGWVVEAGLLDSSRYDATVKDNAYKRAIVAWYRYRAGQPDLADQARLRFIATVLGDLPVLGDADFTPPAGIAAVAVYDTVSSLGVPHIDAQGTTAFDFSICDTALDMAVVRGFHALAADERRELFTPTFWADRAGIVQQIFPGCHSNVGGGLPEFGLSDAALVWMTGQLDGVCGPLFGLGTLVRPLVPDPLGVAHDESRVFPFTLTPHRARLFPRVAAPSAVLRTRFGCETEILPGTLVAGYAPVGTYADGSVLLP